MNNRLVAKKSFWQEKINENGILADIIATGIIDPYLSTEVENGETHNSNKIHFSLVFKIVFPIQCA